MRPKSLISIGKSTYFGYEVTDSGHFQSANYFHKHLIKTAGVGSSPFEMGTGENARRLFCTKASSFYDPSTLSKHWPKIRGK